MLSSAEQRQFDAEVQEAEKKIRDTFNKRQETIFNKCAELFYLTDADTFTVAFRGGEYFVFHSQDEDTLPDLLQRYVRDPIISGYITSLFDSFETSPR